MIAQAHQSARLTDRHWRNASPFLLAAIIDDADAQGFAEVDFLRGEEPYKGRIAPNHREMVRLVAGKGTTSQVRRTAVRCVRFGRSHRRPVEGLTGQLPPPGSPLHQQGLGCPASGGPGLAVKP
jgi:CelD/BcsL family acetyltransferase involved in cellulose biosynthesis